MCKGCNFWIVHHIVRLFCVNDIDFDIKCWICVKRKYKIKIKVFRQFETHTGIATSFWVSIILMVFLQLELILYFPKIGLKGMEGEFLSIQETVKCPLKSPYRHKHDCKVLERSTRWESTKWCGFDTHNLHFPELDIIWKYQMHCHCHWGQGGVFRFQFQRR